MQGNEADYDDIGILPYVIGILVALLITVIVGSIVYFGIGIKHTCHTIPPFSSNDYVCITTIGR